MVVDDDVMIRRLLSRLLTTDLSCEVIEAGHGLEALLAIQVAVPDLVLLDLDMPVMDGLSLLRSLRLSPLHHDLPVVCLSATRDGPLLRTLVGLGIEQFVLKPLDLRTTAAKLGLLIRDLKLKAQSLDPASRV